MYIETQYPDRDGRSSTLFVPPGMVIIYYKKLFQSYYRTEPEPSFKLLGILSSYNHHIKLTTSKALSELQRLKEWRLAVGRKIN